MCSRLTVCKSFVRTFGWYSKRNRNWPYATLSFGWVVSKNKTSQKEQNILHLGSVLGNFESVYSKRDRNSTLHQLIEVLCLGSNRKREYNHSSPGRRTNLVGLVDLGGCLNGSNVCMCRFNEWKERWKRHRGDLWSSRFFNAFSRCVCVKMVKVDGCFCYLNWGNHRFLDLLVPSTWWLRIWQALPQRLLFLAVCHQLKLKNKTDCWRYG